MVGTRRSARSNKGQHSLREKEVVYEDSDNEAPVKRAKVEVESDDDEYNDGEKEEKEEKVSDSGSDSDGDEEDDDVKQNDVQQENNHDNEGTEDVRCTPCDTNKYNYDESTDKGGMMIFCDGCNTWQHAKCMGYNKKTIDNDYRCDVCTKKTTPKDNLQLEGLKNKTRISVAKAFFHVFDRNVPKDFKSKEGLDHSEVCRKWALELEKAVFKQFPLKDKHYTDKSRGIMTLIKKPNVINRIMDNSLSFDKVVNASPEEIDDELKAYAEKVRQESIRRSVLTSDENQGQRIKRTHKGEELVEVETNNEEQDVNIITKSVDHRRFNDDSQSPPPETKLSDEINNSNNNTNSYNYNTVGLDDEDDVGQGSEEEDQDDDDDEDNEAIHYLNDSEDDSGDDDDIEKILKAGNEKPKEKPKEIKKPQPTKPKPTKPKPAMKLPPLAPSHIWKGPISFPDFASFTASVEFLTATNYNLPTSYQEAQIHNKCIEVSKAIFKQSFYDIEGRLDKAKAEPYLNKITTTRDFYVYEIKGQSNAADFDKLYKYLLQRQKVGVLSGKPDFAKDSYLLSLDGGPLPEYLSQLNQLDNKSGLFALYVVKKDYVPAGPSILKRTSQVQSQPSKPQPMPQPMPQQHQPQHQQSQAPILDSILSKLGDTTTQPSNSLASPPSQQSTKPQVPGLPPKPMVAPSNYQQPFSEQQNGLQNLSSDQIGYLTNLVQQNSQVQQNPQQLLNLLQQQRRGL